MTDDQLLEALGTLAEQDLKTFDELLKLADAQVEAGKLFSMIGERTTLLEKALLKIGRGLEKITDAHKARIVELEDDVALLEGRVALVERS